MDKQGLRSFDFIKLDLQGNELKALKGAAKALKSCKAILVEVNFRERYEGCTQFNQLYDVLADAGFCLYKIYDIHRSEEHTSELQSLMRISYAVFFLQKKN